MDEANSVSPVLFFHFSVKSLSYDHEIPKFMALLEGRPSIHTMDIIVCRRQSFPLPSNPIVAMPMPAMDAVTGWMASAVVLLLLLLAAAVFARLMMRRQGDADAPPSPPSSLPLLVHLHLLQKPPLHRSLATLSQAPLHRRMAGRDVEMKKGVIDVLLEQQEADPEQYTDTIIKGIVLALLTEGTDTEAMRKARAEIEASIGTGRLVEEPDIPNLPYLQCVVKETLRLCPVGPVIPAHEGMEDCIVGGFRVRPGTMTLVNAWAIQRDADVWDMSGEFSPERFSDTDMVTAPMLPGEGLAMRVVSLTLAALVQCFEWGCCRGCGYG
ncbi:hypothetical protein BRADI_4g03450v3 [Brachypodium distachyon]|uniref:Cytochrome P450 n=1 Tax=Brachypodium distachyon TaxID=15368 RepID=A0A0Q3EIE9_BRADI|nr:hypothetical protein BRADI_4g03450v3 [Brachypodium distachyon]